MTGGACKKSLHKHAYSVFFCSGSMFSGFNSSSSSRFISSSMMVALSQRREVGKGWLHQIRGRLLAPRLHDDQVLEDLMKTPSKEKQLCEGSAVSTC